MPPAPRRSAISRERAGGRLPRTRPRRRNRGCRNRGNADHCRCGPPCTAPCCRPGPRRAPPTSWASVRLQQLRSFRFLFGEQLVELALVGEIIEGLVEIVARLHQVDDALLRSFLADRIVDLERRCVHGAERGERSEEHTSELQSPVHLGCRLLLEKKNSKLWVSLTQHRWLSWPLRLVGTTMVVVWLVRQIDVPAFFLVMIRRPPRSTLCPYAALFR